MRLLLVSLFLAAQPALAGTGEEDTGMTAEEREALARSEAIRLAEELDRLAKRNAWAGVERTFQELLATGETPSYEDFKIGAHSAQAVGDIGAAHERLRRAYSIRESKEVLDWMWAIREAYGPVELLGDPGKVELSPAAMPFDPVKAKAVEFAVTHVTDTGAFVGLLPKGTYMFGGREVVVSSFVDKRIMHLQTESGERRSKKMRKKGE